MTSEYFGVRRLLRESRSKRQWSELDVVCGASVGLEVIAPDICRILRGIVGADAGALFWMGQGDLPVGFFHEDSSGAVRDLFANAYEELFVGPAEINVASLIRRKDRASGHVIAPPESYWRSNTYNLLVRASGHQHSLDLRIDENGVACAVLLLFRERGRPPFTEDHMALLQMALPALRRAVHLSPAPQRWSAKGSPAYLLVDGLARQLLFCSPTATDLLQRSNLVAQGVPMFGALTAPPAFAAELSRRLKSEHRPRIYLPIPEGRLHITAERLAANGGKDATLITLQHEEPDRIAIMRRVLGLDLSPRQKSIMLAAAAGASRAEAAEQTSTSPEAMKKHLAAIFDVVGARSWTDLTQVFGTRSTGESE